MILVGDYHALAASQDFAAALTGQLVQEGRPVVLALEMAFSRDQYVLDEWLRGEISEEELRAGIRYDDEWGYDWEPFARLDPITACRAVLDWHGRKKARSK